MKPQISIIVPNYNYGRYLRDCLDSVRAQTFQDWECIVIDDGSEDDSVKIIQKYCARDKRFRLIKNPHAGIPAARNAGIDAACGEYIAFLDSDDCYAQIALENLHQIARMTGADMVGGQALIVSKDFAFYPCNNAAATSSRFFQETNPSVYFCRSGDQQWFWIWRRIYKRALIGDARFDTNFESVGEDIAFMLDLGCRATNMAECGEIVCYHRKHVNSVSLTASGAKYFSFFPTVLDCATKMRNEYDQNFWKTFYNAIVNYLLFETVFKPKMYKVNMPEARKILIESAKKIPMEYLPSWRSRMLIRYLKWLK
jgi:CDP-glycerol glycerophosphotransferase